MSSLTGTFFDLSQEHIVKPVHLHVAVPNLEFFVPSTKSFAFILKLTFSLFLFVVPRDTLVFFCTMRDSFV